MTITSRVNLKSDSTDGSIVDQTLFHNIIDSYLHIQDGSAQTITGVLNFTGSATFNTINANDIDVSAINANVISLANITTSGVKATNVSAATIVVSGSASFGNINCNDIDTSALSFSRASGGNIVVSAVSAHAMLMLSGSVSFNIDTTAVASGGGAGVVPTSAEGFIVWTINGRELLVPFFEKG